MDINVKITLEAPSLIETLTALFSGIGTRTVTPSTAATPAPTAAATNIYLPTPVPQSTRVPTVPPQAYTSAPPPTAYTVPISVPAAPPPVPVTQAPAYNMDTLANAAAGLMQTGKQQELVALLGQFGVQALTQLKPEQYGAFATTLRQMGGKI